MILIFLCQFPWVTRVFAISGLMNVVPNSASLTRRMRLRRKGEGKAFSYDQPEVPLDAERSHSPSRLPSPPPEDIDQFQFHTLIDSQLVNDRLFPGGKLFPYGAPHLGGMYDYVVGSVDHWVEWEAEFVGLNAVEDVVQSEEFCHRVIQQLAFERV